MFGVISATYTDKGGPGGVPTLSTTSQVQIRQRMQEVEHVVTQSGTNTGTNTDGPTGTGVHRGSLANNDWLQLNGPFNLANIDTVWDRARQAGLVTPVQIVVPTNEKTAWKAISGDSTFPVERDQLAVNGATGDLLLPEITMPQEYHSIEIGRDGRVTVIEQLGEDETELGQITLARFTNPGGLSPIGKNLFIATPAAGDEQRVEPGQPGEGELKQGAIEASNVNAISELIAMIQGQRAYEINSNVIETADEAMQIANNLRG